jgi:hypothetical protein
MRFVSTKYILQDISQKVKSIFIIYFTKNYKSNLNLVRKFLIKRNILKRTRC